MVHPRFCEIDHRLWERDGFYPVLMMMSVVSVMTITYREYDAQDYDDEEHEEHRDDHASEDDLHSDFDGLGLASQIMDPEVPYFWTPEGQPYLTMPTHESPGPTFQAIQWHHNTGDKDTAVAIIIEDFYDNIYRAFLQARNSRRHVLSHTKMPCIRDCTSFATTHLWSHCPTPSWEWPGPEGLFARQVPQDGIFGHFHFYCRLDVDWMHTRSPVETDAMDVDVDIDSEGEEIILPTLTPGAPLFLGGCEDCFGISMILRETYLHSDQTNTRYRVVWLQGHHGGPPKVPHLIQVHREERTDIHGNTTKWDVPGAMQNPIPGRHPFDRFWDKKGVGPWKVEPAKRGPCTVEPAKRKRGRRHKNNKTTGTGTSAE